MFSIVFIGNALILELDKSIGRGSLGQCSDVYRAKVLSASKK